jgi:MFS family permease
MHYAWVIAFAAMLVVLGAVGFARFAFGMVLPAMAADLALDYRQQGILSASYFVGYLTIVIAMLRLAPRLGCKNLCVGGLAVVAVALFAMSLSREYEFLSVSYFIAGLGSGAAFVGAMSLPSHWFHPSHRGLGGGLIVAGAGLGILLSGFLVPRIPHRFTFSSWQLIWLLFATLCTVFCIVAARVLHNRPSDIALLPYGRADPLKHRSPSRTATNGSDDWPFLIQLGTIYALFGATALTYSTFIVTTMLNDRGLPAATAALLWSVIGVLSVFSGGLFGKLSDHFGRRAGILVALSAQAIAYLLVATDSGMGGMYVSIFLFGVSVFSMPTIVAAATADRLGAEAMGSAFAILTVILAVGQVVGPAGAGFLADWSGSFTFSFATACALNSIGVVLCFFLKLR